MGNNQTMTTMILAVLMFFAGCLAGGGITDTVDGTQSGTGSGGVVIYTEPPLMQMNGTATECWEPPSNGTCLTVAGLMMTTNGTTAIEVVAMWTTGYMLVSNCSSQTRTMGIPGSGSIFLLSDGGACDHHVVWIPEPGQDNTNLSFSWSILYRSHAVDPQSWPHATGYTPQLPTLPLVSGWNFQATDADGAISGGTGDTLLRVAWTNAADDLNWAFVTFTLEVGDNVYSCSTRSDADCSFDQTGSDDTKWEHNEILYLKENGVNICGSSEENANPACTLDITVSYNGAQVSGTPERTIA